MSATNKDLYSEMQEGRFREDLFYRINVFTIRLPSLIERQTDIALLAKYYIDVYAKKLNKNVKDTSLSFLDKLKKHNWPGNIRELKNVIERAVILSDGPVLTEEHLPSDLSQRELERDSTPLNHVTDLESVEKNHIKNILNQTNGNKIKAASLLKIGIATLYRKIEQYKLNTL
jgi:transcriptional regulator with PAS, ATPase and Fis domain